MRRYSPTAPAALPTGNRMLVAAPVTLVEQIVDAIVKAASEGTFRPGQRLNEVDIARRMSVSRVPVREALRVLESQGIACRTIGGRGLVLMPVDESRLHQILVVRNSLEQLAGRAVAGLRGENPQLFANIELALRDMEHATLVGDGYAHARADLEFHRALCEISRNEVLLQIWGGLSRRLTVFFGLATLQRDMRTIYREHVELLEILRHGNESSIAVNIEKHIIDFTAVIDVDLLVAGRPSNLAEPPKSP
jgi:DNA-binding GntR family transcriptional regulator